MDRTWFLIFLLALLVVLVVVLGGTQTECYEVAKNQDYRLLYYTGNAHHFLPRMHYSLRALHEKHPHDFSMEYIEKYYALDFPRCEALYEHRKSLPFPASYVEDLYQAWSLLDARYREKDRVLVWYPRDRVERFDVPVLVKSRVFDRGENGHGSILLKLNTIRHYQRMGQVAKHRIHEPPFREKIPTLVWRGAPTGFGFGNNIPPRSVSRQTLVEKYALSTSSLLDIGLVIKKDAHKTFKEYAKDEVPLERLLKYKYLLSVEGNDVATNLKWILASNSLVVMPRPQISSWLMEDALLPYVHYLPVRDDFSDVEAQIRWAERHPKKCERMIASAHRYVEPFLDTTREDKVQGTVLKYYLDHFSWSD